MMDLSVLKSFYSYLSEGQLQQAVSLCAPQVTFQIPGKSPIAGKYTAETFVSEFYPRCQQRSAGTYQLAIHDLMGTELHAVALGSSKITRNQKTYELRTVHVWRLEQGRPIAFYEYPRDLYAFDEAWS